MAVFTKLNENDFKAVLNSYDIGDFICAEGIAEGVENTNYKLITSKDKYILTIYEKRVRTEDLPFFMNLQKKLNDMGFPCPKPIISKNSTLINAHSGKNYTIVSFLNGKWSLDLDLNEVEQGAKILAEFHNFTKKIDKRELSRENSLGKKFWIDTYTKIKVPAEEKFKGLKELVAKGFAEIEKIPSDLPKGIIHADLFPDNVLFENKKVSGVIDFYMACNDDLAYDLAIMLNSWCFEKDFSFNKTKAEKLLNIYNTIRPLQQNEFDNFRLLGIASSIRFMCSRLHDYFIRDDNAIVNVKDPAEYIEKLKFHLNVKSNKEYGL